MENRVTTAWLDAIIAREMQLRPPSTHAVAICGALLKAHLATCAIEEKVKKEYLWRNACPPPEMLTMLIENRVEFIWSQTKFVFEVFRHSREIFTLSANGSLTQARSPAISRDLQSARSEVRARRPAHRRPPRHGRPS